MGITFIVYQNERRTFIVSVPSIAAPFTGMGLSYPPAAIPGTATTKIVALCLVNNEGEVEFHH